MNASTVLGVKCSWFGRLCYGSTATNNVCTMRLFLTLSTSRLLKDLDQREYYKGSLPVVTAMYSSYPCGASLSRIGADSNYPVPTFYD